MEITTTSQTLHHNPPRRRVYLSSAAAAFEACAACKHQRRKCSHTCLLRPYFPASKMDEFTNVHKLLGVSKLAQLLTKLPQDQRRDAAESVIYEANARAVDPVGGCVRVICDLERKLRQSRAELEMTVKLLDFCRSRELANSCGILPATGEKQSIGGEHIAFGMS